VASKEDLAFAIIAQLGRTSTSGTSLVSNQDTLVNVATPASVRTLCHVRFGLGLIILYETTYLFWVHLILQEPATVYLLILLDITVTSIAFALTRTCWCRRRWRELVLFECSGVVISSVVISALTGQSIQCFIAAVFLQVGAAVLVPWGARWQAALMTVCLCAIVAGSLVVPSAGASTTHLWMELLAVVGLAQLVTALTQGYRSEVNGRIKELRLMKPSF
jgi:glucose-6-phosphate-specific signal transduction histidine kinase